MHATNNLQEVTSYFEWISNYFEVQLEVNYLVQVL